MNRAIAAHEKASPFREIIAATSGRNGPRTFAVAIREGEPARVIDQYTVRVHDGRFSVVDQGHVEPATDWEISVDRLRAIVDDAEACVADPGRLELGWLEQRLGLASGPEAPQGWRIGRVRRPS